MSDTAFNFPFITRTKTSTHHAQRMFIKRLQIGLKEANSLPILFCCPLSKTIWNWTKSNRYVTPSNLTSFSGIVPCLLTCEQDWNYFTNYENGWRPSATYGWGSSWLGETHQPFTKRLSPNHRTRQMGRWVVLSFDIWRSSRPDRIHYSQYAWQTYLDDNPNPSSWTLPKYRRQTNPGIVLIMPEVWAKSFTPNAESRFEGNTPAPRLVMLQLLRDTSGQHKPDGVQ